MQGTASTGRRDLPRRRHLHFRGGRKEEQDLLPESVLDRQDVSRSQDALLRRRAVFVLRHDRGRRQWREIRGLLFQREANASKQCQLHYDAAGPAA